MQALSAPSRYSCGLAWVLVPAISYGSLTLKSNDRATRLPPISKPLMSARLRAPPCQVLVTRQRVRPAAGSALILAIRSWISATGMPLTGAILVVAFIGQVSLVRGAEGAAAPG